MSYNSVFNRTASKRIIVQITLAISVYFSSCAAVIAEPRIIESSSFSSGQMSFEFADSFVETVKSGPKIMVNIVRPACRNWVNFFQFSMESIGKFLSGSIENIFSISMQYETMSSDDAKETDNDANRPCDISCEDIGHLFPMMFLFALSIYTLITQQCFFYVYV